MYDLTCPSCEAKVARPFIRIGARAVCSQCSHQYQIDHGHVNRHWDLPNIADGNNPLLIQGVDTKSLKMPSNRPEAPKPQPNPQPKPLAPSEPSASLESGASQQTPSPVSSQVASAPALVQKQADQVASSSPPSAPPALKPEPAISARRASVREARQKALRRRNVLLAWLLGVMVVLLIVTVIVLYLELNEDESYDMPLESASAISKQPLHVNQAENAKPLSLADVSSEIQIVQSEALEQGRWQSVAEAYQPAAEHPLIAFKGGLLMPSSVKQMTYVISIYAPADQVIEQAVLELKLVDAADRVFAKMTVDLLLLGSTGGADIADKRADRTLRVLVPRELGNRAVRVAHEIKSVKMLSRGSMRVVSPKAEQIGEGERAGVHVWARNPLKQLAVREIFILDGQNIRGESVAQYRVVLKNNIKASDPIEFVATVAIKPSWKVASWHIIGAVESVGIVE